MRASVTILLLFFAVCFLLTPRVQAQCGGTGQLYQTTNVGTEFLLCFEQNDVVERQQGDDGYLDIYLAATDEDAMVSIRSNRYPRLNRVISLPKRTAHTYRITTDTIQYHGQGRQLDTVSDLWITSQELADPRVVQVTATKPIICYGMNHKVNTTDAFLALPKSASGTEYRIMSYYNSSLSDSRPTQFAVAAFDDGTKVTITPSVATSSRKPAGVPFTVTLQRGEAVQVQADPTIQGMDLTGSEVRADHPVAVYGSHARAEVPLGFTTSESFTSRDHLTEAMPPVTSWGRVFVLSAIDIDNAGNKRPEGDLMRVLALNDNTQVRVNGVLWTTLVHNAYRDSLIQGPVLIEASGPVLTALYAHTSTNPSDQGDPFMAIVPPVDQTYNDFTFFASEDAAFGLQKVIISADSRSTEPVDTNGGCSIIFDNRRLPSIFFRRVGDSVEGRAFSITQLGVEPGVHTLRSELPPEQGMTILMYGLGRVDSYGYTAGLLLRPQRTLAVSSHDGTGMRSRSDEITFHNIGSENVYLDSSDVVFDDPESKRFGIALKENVMMDIDRVPVGRECTVHLVSKYPLTGAVSGTFRVHGYTPKWDRLEWLEIPFTLYPEAFASVRELSEGGLHVTNYPNPFSNSTTISFQLSEQADLSLTVYDALGRQVETLIDEEMPAGPYAVRFDSRGIAPGVYSYEVRSKKLGVRQVHTMVLGQ